MRYLIVLEQTEAGFAVQAPDLAIATFGKDVEEAKRAAVSAIKANLESYSEIGMEVPARKSVNDHLKNPDFSDLLFAFVDVVTSKELAAA